MGLAPKQRGRISFTPDTQLEARLEARRAQIEQETGQPVSLSALIRELLRVGLGDTALQARMAEAHFELGPPLARALIRVGQEMQERIIELLREELSAGADD
jgi:hypothetical protein